MTGFVRIPYRPVEIELTDINTGHGESTARPHRIELRMIMEKSTLKPFDAALP